MMTYLYTYINNDLVQFGSGQFSYPFYIGSKFTLWGRDSVSGAEVSQGRFQVTDGEGQLKGRVSGSDLRIWQQERSFGPGEMWVYATPIDDAANAYVQACHAQQYPAPPPAG